MSVFPCHPYDKPCESGGPEGRCRNHGGTRNGEPLEGTVSLTAREILSDLLNAADMPAHHRQDIDQWLTEAHVHRPDRRGFCRTCGNSMSEIAERLGWVWVEVEATICTCAHHPCEHTTTPAGGHPPVADLVPGDGSEGEVVSRPPAGPSKSRETP